jgi:hypothetical protein
MLKDAELMYNFDLSVELDKIAKILREWKKIVKMVLSCKNDYKKFSQKVRKF